MVSENEKPYAQQKKEIEKDEKQVNNEKNKNELEPQPTDQNKQTQPTNQNMTSELEPISELNETIQQTNKKNEGTDTCEQMKKGY